MSNLGAIRSRLEALMRHAGGTDYAGQVIADNIALVAEVEQLRAGAVVILNNAWEDGAREERQNVVAFLRRKASAMHPAEPDRPMLSHSERSLLLVFAACIERGKHDHEKKE